MPLRVRGDQRGNLIALERSSEIPFDVARAFFIYDTIEGVSRGFHAHRTLNQLAVAVHGACTMVIDDGEVRERVRLASPDQALLMGPMTWNEMHDFTPDCVLLVIADAPFEESEYIRDFEEFKHLAAT